MQMSKNLTLENRPLKDARIILFFQTDSYVIKFGMLIAFVSGEGQILIGMAILMINQPIQGINFLKKYRNDSSPAKTLSFPSG